MKTRVLLVAAFGAVLWAVPVGAEIQVDDMTMHLTDQEVQDRDAGHSGVDAAGLVAESTRLAGGDPGQWWFSPVRGLGFDTRKARTDALWNMTTDGQGPGLYRLDLGGVNTSGTDRGIDVFLAGGGGDEAIADIDDVQGSFSTDFMVTADDIDGSGNIRLRAATGTGNGQNGTIGDMGDSRTGTATLSFLDEFTPTDSMTTHLTDQEVTDRNAEHSGRDAAGLVAELTRLDGGDPGQWWFSPVRGLGFDSSRGGDRDNAEWNMSTGGNGPGEYRLLVVGVEAPRDQGRGIDLLIEDTFDGTRLISDLDGTGTFGVDVTITAADIDDNGNIRLRAEASGVHPVTEMRQNGTIGDLGNGRQGQVHLFFVGATADLVGDANRDGVVDDADLSLLLANWQQDATGDPDGGWGRGEFDGIAPVQDSDLSLLLANWTGAGAVPDPATLALLAAGGLAVLRRRR